MDDLAPWEDRWHNCAECERMVLDLHTCPCGLGELCSACVEPDQHDCRGDQ